MGDIPYTVDISREAFNTRLGCQPLGVSQMTAANSECRRFRETIQNRLWMYADAVGISALWQQAHPLTQKKGRPADRKSKPKLKPFSKPEQARVNAEIDKSVEKEFKELAINLPHKDLSSLKRGLRGHAEIRLPYEQVGPVLSALNRRRQLTFVSRVHEIARFPQHRPNRSPPAAPGSLARA